MAFEHEMADEDYTLSYFDFNQKHDLILVGSPETVREQIEELVAETGCRHLALFLNFPGSASSRLCTAWTCSPPRLSRTSTRGSGLLDRGEFCPKAAGGL